MRPLTVALLEEEVKIKLPLNWEWISEKLLSELLEPNEFQNIDNLWPDQVREMLPDHVELVGENPVPPYKGRIHRLLMAEMEVFANTYSCTAHCKKWI